MHNWWGTGRAETGTILRTVDYLRNRMRENSSMICEDDWWETECGRNGYIIRTGNWWETE